MGALQTRVAGAEQLVCAYALNPDIGRDPVLDLLDEDAIVLPFTEEVAAALRLIDADQRVTNSALRAHGLAPKILEWLEQARPEAYKEPFPRAAEALRASRAYVTVGVVLEASLADLVKAPLTDVHVARLAGEVADTIQGLAIGSSERAVGEKTARQHAEDWRERFLEDVAHGSCTWGAKELDRRAGTLAPGSLTAVAGLPGHGKSVLAMHASRASAAFGKRVLYVCLEMAESELAMRLMCNASDTYAHTLKNTVRDHDEEGWRDVLEVMPDMTLKVCGLRDARALVRKAHAERRPYDLVVFDYLQMFQFGNERDNEAKRLQDAAYFIKREIAMRYRCAALVLCQFSKQESGADMPLFRNVRGASAIEDAVDIAICIRRDAEPTGEFTYGAKSYALDFTVQKFRNGEVCFTEPYPSVRLFGGKFRIEDQLDSASEVIQ